MSDPGAWIGLAVECPSAWMEANLSDAALPFDEIAREWLDERGQIFEEEISIESPDRDSGLASLRAGGFAIEDDEIRREFESEGGTRWHFVTPGVIGDASARGVLEHWRTDETFTVQLEEVGDHALKIEAEGTDYDAWELSVEVLMCMAAAVAKAGGTMRGFVMGGGDAVWDGAGFVGVAVTDEGMETMIEDEMQDFDPDAAAHFFPEGMLEAMLDG